MNFEERNDNKFVIGKCRVTETNSSGSAIRRLFNFFPLSVY